MSLQVQQEMELGEEKINYPDQQEEHGEEDNRMMEKEHRYHSHKKGLKSLVKSCVKGSKHRKY